MDVLLEGVKSPNNFIRVLLDPSVWGKAIQMSSNYLTCKIHVLYLFELHIGAQKRIALSQQLEQRNKEKRRQGHDPKGREGEYPTHAFAV